MTTTAPDRRARVLARGELVAVGNVCLVLTAIYFSRRREAVPRLLRHGRRTNYAGLTRQG